MGEESALTIKLWARRVWTLELSLVSVLIRYCFHTSQTLYIGVSSESPPTLAIALSLLVLSDYPIHVHTFSGIPLVAVDFLRLI